MIQTSKALSLFLIVVVLMYIGLGLFIFLNEKAHVYYPDIPTSRDFVDCPVLASAEKISYKGARFYYRPQGENSPTVDHQYVSENVVVMYHGNAGNACDRAVFGESFEKMGYSYLLVEYPGYGNDPSGGPSKKRILESVTAIQEFLKEKNYRNVALVGESLGVGVAAYHASTDTVSKLVFISPYYELADMAGWIGSVYPVRFLMKENYTPGIWLKDVKAQMLFMYASDDEIIPAWSADKLYNSVSGEKKKVEIKEATHNTMYDHPEFFAIIEEFLIRL